MQQVEVIVHKWSDLARIGDPDARIVADETLTFSWQGGPVHELDVTAGEYAEISKFLTRLEDAARLARRSAPATDSLTDKRAYRKGLMTWAKEQGKEILAAGTKNERVRRETEREYQATLQSDQVPPKYLLA